MKHNSIQWLTATAMVWHFGTTVHAADNSGAYIEVNRLTVPQNYSIPIALAVHEATAAVGFSSNVTRLYHLSDAPVEGTNVINAYANMGEKKPRTVAVKFFPDNNLCIVDRSGTFHYNRKPYDTYVQKTQSLDKATFSMAVNKDILCFGHENDTVTILDHRGLLKKRSYGKASGGVAALEIVDSKWVITGNCNGSVALIDIEQGDGPIVLGNHGEAITGDGRTGSNSSLCCMAKQDGAIVYTAGTPSEIKIWDIRVRMPLVNSFKYGYGTTGALAVLKTGYLAAGFHKKIGLFDVRMIIGQHPIELLHAGTEEDIQNDSVITALAPTDDGGFLSATSSGVVKVWK